MGGTVTMMTHPSPTATERPPQAAQPCLRQDRDLRVLIVEDEPELAEILEVNLAHRGFTTLCAENGLTACRLVSAERPELILLDILLPDLDGWEICRMIRSHPDPAVARTPIIMLSALGDPEDRLRGFELGADAYLPKPYSLKELVPKAQQLAARYRADLEQERELAELRSRVQQHDAWQQLLFHELRNQMFIISGYARQLAKPGARDHQEKSRHWVQAIRRSSGYLTNLANEFQLIHQIEQGQRRLPAEPFTPRALIEETLGLLTESGQFPQQRISSVLAEVPTCQLSGTAFKLILGNLIDNALKYGEQSPVELRLEPLDGGFRLLIRDRGPGIPAAELPFIFDKFYRGSGSREKVLGTGLGLYTARTLAEALGGDLQVASAPGSTEFTLRLPLVGPHPESPTPPNPGADGP